MENNIERELGWDDVIENDGTDYELLPEGDYDFEVESFERGRYDGGNKIPPCNMAVLNIKLTAQDGVTATIKHRLYLHTKTEGLMCAFFRAIGQRQKGERLIPNWNAVPGSRGRCKVDIRKYKGDDGNERQTNNIKRFYDAEKPSGGYTPGAF